MAASYGSSRRPATDCALPGYSFTRNAPHVVVRQQRLAPTPHRAMQPSHSACTSHASLGPPAVDGQSTDGSIEIVSMAHSSRGCFFYLSHQRLTNPHPTTIHTITEGRKGREEASEAKGKHGEEASGQGGGPGTCAACTSFVAAVLTSRRDLVHAQTHSCMLCLRHHHQPKDGDDDLDALLDQYKVRAAGIGKSSIDAINNVNESMERRRVSMPYAHLNQFPPDTVCFFKNKIFRRRWASPSRRRQRRPPPRHPVPGERRRTTTRTMRRHVGAESLV